MEFNKNTAIELQDKLYDCLVIGGGTGGLSAGIYLQRFLLRSIVLEKGKGRSVWIQNLNNYLGLSPETPGHQLLREGKNHYLSLNGDYLNSYVEQVFDQGDYFRIVAKINKKDNETVELKSKYLIAASGIMDNLPELEDMRNVYNFAGHNLHVCMVCDGYEMKDKECGLFINSSKNIEMAFKLSWFTKKIKIFTNGTFEVSEEFKQKLQDSKITLHEEKIKQLVGEKHQMSGVELISGEIINIETGLISMGSQYHNHYLKEIEGLEWKGENLITDNHCRTSHRRIFAVGDLKVGLNQVSIAVGDGANAAHAIWNDFRNK